MASHTVGAMRAIEALDRIAELLMRSGDQLRSRAFRQAATSIKAFSDDELRHLAETGGLRELPAIGKSTERVILEALEGGVPAYLERLQGEGLEPGTEAGDALRARLRGDLHLHSDWSDGGASIRDMAEKAIELGHDYIALTDHSPRLSIANGLTPERLEQQLGVVADLNAELAPFRILTGIEVDINEDGTLDQTDDLLGEVDVVVASVHSKLRMERAQMTERMLLAMANPHSDVLGHCTGRMVTGRGRPESEFDADMVFAACWKFDKAVEVNCRPERLDPPRRLLSRVVELDLKVAIDTDAHAIAQLNWHPYGCDRAAECGVESDHVVNAWPVEQLLEWTADHAAGVVRA
jgi:putative hydrolase